ncbi:GIY-YIG nuclease family protein [Flavobacterium sp. 25HG05S-40]|uniref:GIY-YIG nuclease family protein n=1 Tax=Flavobacterium sp. 25HG05S-40 TaxID=3458682 RepID=UPI004043CC31
MDLVYILHSVKINRFYIGYTSDIKLRLEFHANAESHKFTYNADDWTLFLTIECESKSQALAIEKHIKAMKSKVYIENLKKYPEIKEKLLEKYKSVDC